MLFFMEIFTKENIGNFEYNTIETMIVVYIFKYCKEYNYLESEE